MANLDKQAHIWHPKRPAYLRVRSAASYCGLSPKTIWQAIKAGNLPAYRVRGMRVVLLKTRELLTWIGTNIEPYRLKDSSPNSKDGLPPVK